MSFPVKTKSWELLSTENLMTHFSPSLPLTNPVVPSQWPSVITTLHLSTGSHGTRYLGWIEICWVQACLTTLIMISPSWGCNACSSVSTVFARFPLYSHSKGSPDTWIVNWIHLYSIIFWILSENSQWPAILEWVQCDTVFYWLTLAAIWWCQQSRGYSLWVWRQSVVTRSGTWVWLIKLHFLWPRKCDHVSTSSESVYNDLHEHYICNFDGLYWWQGSAQAINFNSDDSISHIVDICIVPFQRTMSDHNPLTCERVCQGVLG